MQAQFSVRTYAASSLARRLLVLGVMLAFGLGAQDQPKDILRNLDRGVVHIPTKDDHVLLCHGDFLRFYRVRVVERDQRGAEHKSWTGWRLVSDTKAEDKEQYQADMKFYRENTIEVQFAAVEGKLPE
jgi:hypothetical protein